MHENAEVGLIGLGVMGAAIGRRLLETGHELRGFDISPDARQELAAAGADTVTSAEELATCATVILSLNTAAVVEQVVFGDHGLLAGMAPGLLIIDMSSIDPEATRRLAARAVEHGARWVDAPLSGGAPAVAKGALTLMVGGADADVAAATDVLSDLASRITHIGPPGSGQLVKLINQVLVGSSFAAIAEAAAMARSARLPPEQVLAALSGGRADSALLQEFFVKFAEKDLTPTGRISNMIKDLETARDYARSASVPLPITTGVAELHRWLGRAGHGASDSAALMLYYEPEAEA